jgi:hypothetical protein
MFGQLKKPGINDDEGVANGRRIETSWAEFRLLGLANAGCLPQHGFVRLLSP